MPRAVVATGSVDMTSAPLDVWPLLTDTDRTNRIIGGAPVVFEPIDTGAEAGTSARFLATTVAGGFRVSYEEAPFEWSEGRSFSVQRKMRSGPVLSYALHWTLEARGEGQGTRATVRLEIVPRYWFLRPIASLNARRFVANLIHLAESIDSHLRDKAPSPYLKPVSPVDGAYLALSVAEMKKRGVDDAMVERISSFVRDAADADVLRIRPFELADTWGEDRHAVLRAFLRAVPAGLVELRWGILCPSCLTASQQVRALDEIGLEGHCQLCDISFELDLDRAVEATFLPHPSIRRIPEQLFCIGGPARTPHVVVQSTFAKGESKALDAPQKPGRYRLFARGGASATVDIHEGAPREASASLQPTAVQPARIEVAPGGAVQVTNACDEPRHAKIERIEFANTAATAHIVTTIGEFRTLFSSDLLKRGTPLKVARIAVLFSDLTGSTALYSTVGDAAAFRLVDDHFDVLRRAIEEHEGTVVKTMGDAVMASFADTAQCARGALAVLERFESFRAAEPNGKHIGLKLGMFAGPCYVVTANGVLDYFGQTVNVASRIQHLAGAGELVLTRADLEALAPAERARIVVVEEFDAAVKGVEAKLDLIRVRLAEALLPAPPMSMRTLPEGVSKVT